MAWTLSTSLDDFRDRAGGFLAAHPAENTVLLTVVDRLAERGLNVFGERPPVFGWWRASEGGPVAGAFLRTPPYEPRLGLMPVPAAAELATELAAAGPEFSELAGVSGGADTVRSFAAAWSAATGAGHSVVENQRLYRLGELTGPPRPPAGRHRPAEPGDRDLVIRWYGEFRGETGVMLPNIPQAVDDRIAAGGLHLWEDDGHPVALAGNSPVTAGMSRIGPVYTPADLRGRGYASAVTAAASAHALAQGAAEVLLYTDLANPTSNSIYQQIGYRPVEDCLAVDFAR
ncbi:GNAT family N-acetyltransferase [Streptomyces kaniharaensis]|uniref:GNAT family N-acetyltransferase n=1 Tax=Streptomyces kaniharaensis TaxID=212423 RepID=A0A6N7KSL1_9ACTN|nr:GNAT family N-acetyltransferase [Streptomyces kaniharaensis]MQS13795.1 GNAT family N-acetyltransferase [Streptomyces kaniharaensis]